MELTGRDRATVAKQFAGFVEQHGRTKADELLDRALATAREKPRKPAPSGGVAAQPAVADQPSQPAPAAPSPPAASPAPQPQPEPEGKAAATEDVAPESKAAEPAAAPAAPPKEESAADNGSPDEVSATSDKGGALASGNINRPADLIALRKRESILKSIKECLA